jgi:hypothetical protein
MVEDLTTDIGAAPRRLAGHGPRQGLGHRQAERPGLRPNVQAEQFAKPSWTRGEESAELVGPYPMTLVIVGLGRTRPRPRRRHRGLQVAGAPMRAADPEPR